jgi:proline iminopeptidase
MHVTVNGIRLFFDVTGTKLAPSGPAMREKPTLILLHGGPGYDHSMLRPHMDAFSDIAQVIYLDQRGTGRSDHGSPSDWRTDQWADDLRAFCDVLGIEKPFVLGESSGGMVVQAYAACHPDHPAGIILAFSSPRLDRTAAAAAFRKLGGDKAGDAAQRFLANPSMETVPDFSTHCMSVYSTRPLDVEGLSRIVANPECSLTFLHPNGESGALDLRPQLAKVRCPVLVLSGAKDPIFPPQMQDELVSALPAGRARLVRLANTGHLLTDEWPLSQAAIREFIGASVSA